MPGYPGTPSIQTVTDVLATIVPSVGNVAGYYIWLVNTATGVLYGPSGKTDSGGNWSIASVPAGIYETFYGTESPTGTAPTRWQSPGVTGYLVALNPASNALRKPFGQGGYFFDVTAYGAKGDNATDDTTAIQNAITAAGVGGTVFFPAGAYRISAPLSITAGAQTLMGWRAGTLTLDAVVIRPLAGFTGSLLSVNVGSGQKGFQLYGVKLDGNNEAALVAGIDYLSNQINQQMLERVTIVNCPTGIRVAGTNYQMFHLDYVNIAACSLGLDLSGTNIRLFSARRCSVSALNRALLLGPDDAVDANTLTDFRYADGELYVTSDSAVDIGLVRNVAAGRITNTWIEVATPTVTLATMLDLGTGNTGTIPTGFLVDDNRVQGNSKANFFCRLTNGTSHRIFFNRCSGLNTTIVSVVAATTAGEVGFNQGGSGSPVDSTTGLSFCHGETTLATPPWKMPIAMSSASGTDLLTLSNTGDANPTVKLRTGATPGLFLGPGGGTSPDINVRRIGTKTWNSDSAFGRSTQSPAFAASFTPACGSGDLIFIGALTANITINAPTGVVVAGQKLVIFLLQGGAGGFTVTWNAIFKVTWSDAGNATGARASVEFYYDGANWLQAAPQRAWA